MIRRPRLLSLAVLIGYVAGAVLVFSSTWLDPAHRWIGPDNGDPEILIWHLRWLPFALGHGHDLLVTNFLDYPDGFNLMWNASLIFPALVLAPVTLLFGAVASYNVLATLALALSAWCAFLAFRRYVRPSAAAVGGLLYGFSPFVVGAAGGHTHVAIAVFPPLALLMLDEIVVRRRRSPVLLGALLGLAAGLQLLTGEEVLAISVVAAVFGLAALALLHRDQVRSRLPAVARGLAVAVAVFAVIAAYPLGVQFFGDQRVHGTLQPTNFFVVDAAELVVPTPQQALSTGPANRLSARFTGQTELGGYIGIPLLLLVAFVMVRYRRDPLVRFAGVLAVVVLVLSLGPRLHVAGHSTGIRLPWTVLQRLPLFGNLLPARLAIVTFLLLGLLVAIYVDRGRRPAALVVGLLALLPVAPNHSYVWAPSDSPRFFASSAVESIPGGSVSLVLPESARPMLWQQEADFRFRMPEGYVFVPGPALEPPPFTRYGTALFSRLLEIEAGGAPAIGAGERRQVLCDLFAFDIRSVVLGPGAANPDETKRFFSGAVGRSPAQTDGVWLWSEIPRPSERCARIRLASGWHPLEREGATRTLHWMKSDGTLTITPVGAGGLYRVSLLAKSAAIPRRLAIVTGSGTSFRSIPPNRYVSITFTAPPGTIRLRASPGAQPAQGPQGIRNVSVAVSGLVVRGTGR